MLPALIERARQEVALARVVGKFTVDVGIATVRRRLEGKPPPSTDTSVESLVELVDHPAETTIDPTDATDPNDIIELFDDVEAVDPLASAASAIHADQLVLPDYDHLPAAHIVAKLSSLTQAERDAVEEYETANRHRRTILGKLDQLRAAR